MRKKLVIPELFGIHAEPGIKLQWLLGLLPFILMISVYLYQAEIRHKANPDDKLTPFISQMVDAVKALTYDESVLETEEYIEGLKSESAVVVFQTKLSPWTNSSLFVDTVASLRRLFIGLTLSSVVGLLIGINMGKFPGFRFLVLPFVTFWSIIPPLAILPIILVVMGVEEKSKIALIFIGLSPVIARDIFLTVIKIPKEQTIKVLTLGASQLDLVYRVTLPQIFPRLIENIRLQLGPAWIFLIAAEGVASSEGLGYRIFLVRRYMDLATIIPDVLWITFIGFTMDQILKQWLKRKYSWYTQGTQE
jgi:NitT/TauT family transport system permease protein